MKALQLLAGWSWNNPVTLKELRIGLRERRVFILQVVYLCVLLLISLTCLPGMFESPNSEQLADKGKEFFFILFGLQLMLLLITAPALTCGSLSSERERHTLDMVLASRISSGQLVLGKLGFAAYTLILLLSSALPLASICFFLGGVTLWEALGCYFELFLFGMLGASVGLFSSAREARSNYATVQSYLLVFLCSFLVFPYMAMRFDNHSAQTTIGPSFWTFNQTIEVGVYHFFVGLALYLISFLFVKARHRIRPEARNLRAMALLFLLIYLFCLGWLALLYASVYSNQGRGDDDPLAILLYVAHICCLGFFLNPHNLESRLEQKRFRASLFSRPWFWLGLCLLGCLFPLALRQACGYQNELTTYELCFSLFFLLVYPLNAWFFQKSWLPRWQFAWVYYLGLLLLQFFPALGVFTKGDSTTGLSYISPFSTLIALARARQENHNQDEILILALSFHLVLLVVFAAIYRWRTRRRKQIG
jgi:ABC-type transport system involved in multi-copper enzyme maturation permease subunit